MAKVYNEIEIRNDYAKLTKRLIEKNMTITTMESCTAGQLASLITDTDGASAVLKGAFVTYCNDAKIMQGVPEEIIDKYSVYSKETACAMAVACRKTYNADIGVGVTGTMGSVDPANASVSVPGQVWFAFSFKDRTIPFFIELSRQPARFEYKMAVAKRIVDELFKIL